MSTATCTCCGGTFVLPTVASDSPDEARAREERLRQMPICGPCHDDWTLELCPDGEEHEYAPTGVWDYSAVPLLAEECVRCGAVSLVEAVEEAA